MPDMSNKNWNDRADKDLFFTILSVKNIGVISGGEWTTIGNHMRSMGYGFTNEGCRQHFQGLRRAQNKTESSSASPHGGIGGESSGPRKADPTLNPITRRPGPGRGRPRKQPAPGSGMAASPGGSVGTPVTPGGPDAHGHPVTPDLSGLPSGLPSRLPSGLPSGLPNVGAINQSGGGHQIPMDTSLSAQGDTPGGEELAVDPSLEDADIEEHAAKRPRLETNQDPSLEDEAVMNALTAHNNPVAGDYVQDFNYGEV